MRLDCQWKNEVKHFSPASAAYPAPPGVLRLPLILLESPAPLIPPAPPAYPAPPSPPNPAAYPAPLAPPAPACNSRSS